MYIIEYTAQKINPISKYRTVSDYFAKKARPFRDFSRQGLTKYRLCSVIGRLALEQDGGDDDCALERLTQERRNAEQIQEIIHYGDDEHTEHGACNGALAAGHAGAAHDDRRDGIELITAAGVCRVHSADAGDLQYGRDSDNRAHQRIYTELYTIDVDAGKTGRLLVRADREHVAVFLETM